MKISSHGKNGEMSMELTGVGEWGEGVNTLGDRGIPPCVAWVEMVWALLGIDVWSNRGCGGWPGSALVLGGGGRGLPNYVIATFHPVLYGLGWVGTLVGSTNIPIEGAGGGW